jgi:hypothetical protein
VELNQIVRPQVFPGSSTTREPYVSTAMSQNPNNVYFGFSNQQFLAPGQQQGMLQQGMLQQNARLQGTAQGGLLQMQPGLQLMSSSLMSGMQSGTSALQ